MAFDNLPLREQRRRLELLRAAVVLMVSGDSSMIDRMIGDIDPPVDDPIPGAEGVADAVDAWLAGGAA